MTSQLKVGDKAPNFRFDTPWTSSLVFYKIIQHQDAVCKYFLMKLNGYSDEKTGILIVVTGKKYLSLISGL